MLVRTFKSAFLLFRRLCAVLRGQPIPISTELPELPEANQSSPPSVSGELDHGDEPDDKYTATAAERADTCLPVSRHGLQEDGVTCPRCRALAVEPGDWTKIHKKLRVIREDKVEIDRYYEEGACCPVCGGFLMASPDDDIDPVVDGEPYDESIYHTFVRPEGWQPPRQTTLARAPKLEEWVVVEQGVSKDVKGAEHDLSNSEGRIKEIDEGRAKVELAGFSGINKDQFVWFELSEIRPMVFDTLRVGTPVKVLRHKRFEGREGVVSKLPTSMEEAGIVRVKVDDCEITLPVERVRQLIKE